jgi:hypothetical protein
LDVGRQVADAGWPSIWLLPLFDPDGCDFIDEDEIFRMANKQEAA